MRQNVPGLVQRTLPHACGAALLAAVLTCSPALACTGSACVAGAVLPTSGSLAEDHLEFLWRVPWVAGQRLTTSQLHLYKLEAGGRTELAIRVEEDTRGLRHVFPVAPIAAGTQLTMESDEPDCGTSLFTRSAFTVGEPAALPSELGALRLVDIETAAQRELAATDPCFALFEVAAASLKLELADAALPFASVMRHALLIDGEEWALQAPLPVRGGPAEVSIGAPLERELIAFCGDPTAAMAQHLPEGIHRVQWLSRLADGSELRSNTISVPLVCESSDLDAGAPDAGPPNLGMWPPNAAQGLPHASDAGPSWPNWQASGQDLSGDYTPYSWPTPGVRQMGDASAPPPAQGAPEEERAGQGCALAAPARGGAPHALVLWTLAALPWRRRRRQG